MIFFIASSFLVLHQTPQCAPVALQAAFVPRSPPIKTCDALPSEEQDLCRTGEKLFSDVTLSADKQVSCASCHHLNGDISDKQKRRLNDGLARPRLRGRELDLPRTPSLLDVARTSGPFFWNGRAFILSSQPFWPLYGEHELRATPKSLEAFGGAQHVATALAVYMKTFESDISPFDRWIAGDCSALTSTEAQGAKLVLVDKGCASCHQGTEFRGNKRSAIRYQNLPMYARAKGEVSYSADAELAQFSGDGTTAVLQTVSPSLRNLKLKSPPYGRFGQHPNLKLFLKQHSDQIEEKDKRFLLSTAEENAVLKFLTESLASRL